MMARIRQVFAGLIVASLGCQVRATGVMLPEGEDSGPLAIKYQRVTVDVSNQVARTQVKQAFVNPTARQLEAVYVFPLPRDASVTEFAMLVNGRRVTGELLEKDKARQVYQDIVRRLRDPGLLEYLGANLFRARVFPIPPRGVQEVEISYAEVVPKDSGICRYVYPLRTDERASRTMEDFTVSVRISSAEPIRTVYSPTHPVDVVRKSDSDASAGFETVGYRLDTDFELYWTVSDKDFGVSLLTRRTKGQDGFFLLMVTPKPETKAEDVLRKDMVFVLDTSGSMGPGGKLAQAKSALSYCVSSLNDGDRFNVVRFSTDVEAFRPGLVTATKENSQQAREFIERFPARGGTDINSALETALSLRTGEPRPFIVVFLTDGIPTVGTTDTSAILANVDKRNTGRTRVFCFGVGYDVNTHLLDRLAQATRAASEYVKPEENLELKVSLFHAKASEPVLAGPTVGFGRIQVSDVYPRELPDLFRGSQLLVFGRYRTAGDTAIELRGEINGKPYVVTDDARFPEESAGNEFVERLWATRKVGFLLDEIRLHGENSELKEEVVRLSREYGIMTPYTSYLVVDDAASVAGVPPQPAAPAGREPARAPSREHGWFSPSRQGFPARWAAEAPASAAPKAGPDGVLARRLAETGGRQPAPRPAGAPATVAAGDAASAYQMLREETGAGAVSLSQRLADLKEARVEPQDAADELRLVAGRAFLRVGGVWIDQALSKQHQVLAVRYGSAAYFRLVEMRPDLAKCLALGDQLIVVLSDTLAIRVGDAGLETLSDADAARLKP